MASNQVLSSLGSDINESVQKHQGRNEPFSIEDVSTLVAAIDVDDNVICRRLDGPGAAILCSIFLQSERCLAQQRGLYLLAVHSPPSVPKHELTALQESVRPRQSDTKESSSSSAIRKQGLDVSLSALCRAIVDSKNLHTSRWVLHHQLEIKPS